MRWSERIGDGKFWMRVWLVALAGIVGWGVLTFIFWMDSVPNLNALSIAALILGTLGLIQNTLTMRKADPKDDL